MERIKNILEKYNIIEFTIVFVAFLIYFCWSLCLPVQESPDEAMRYLVPHYILGHGRLPIGDEKEIVNTLFGFSYAFTPYGPSLFSAFFMKIAFLFTQNETILIIASRVPSVFAGTATVFLCLKIGSLIFEKKSTRWLFAILVGYLPQFVFLSAYLNNDVFAVFACTAIFYYWVRGLKEGWKISICIGLGIALGLCALSYYNAYGFILCSIFVFCCTVLSAPNMEHRWKFLFQRGGIIFAVAFLIAGWFFIRNFVIHNGDFLGMDSMYALGEKYGDEAWKLSNRPTYKNQSLSALAMLRQTSWIPTTICSFFAIFGYMSIRIPEVIYFVYAGIVLFGLCMGIKTIYSDKDHPHSKLFLVNGILVIIIPVLLSIHYSYAIDWQPQGRYVMSGLPMIMFLVALGMEKTSILLDKKYIRASKVLIVFWMLMFAAIFVKVCIPSCTYGI